jgi:DNA repair protein RadA/Sms
MILAVLARRGNVRLATQDVFAATVGGARIGEPASDLAIALAVASAAVDQVLPVDLVALGEVGLAGEVRRVSGIPQRLAEAHRLGFRKALIPLRSGPVPNDIKVVEVGDIGTALGRLRRGPSNVTNATTLTALGATMGILPG